MKALRKLKSQEGIWLDEVPMPTMGHNDLLVKIHKTAICGTDIHIYNWDEWAQKTVPIPLTTGHEFVGKVVDMGGEVAGFKVGDRVSGEGHISCGFCRNCRAGRRHLCRNTASIGVTRPGCFAEYLVLPAINAFIVPDDVPDEIAAFLDPLGNATHTALSFDLVGEDVLITGAGPVGVMAAAIARHVGARNIVVTDVNEYRLELARKMGATRAINVQKTSIADVMKELNFKEGFDVGLEMSGNPHAFNDMIKSVIHGGHIALLGFLPPQTQIDWDLVIMKGLIIKGIYGREMFETWYKMSSMLQSGLKLAPILTHQFPIENYQEAFTIMRSGNAGKVILDWE